MNALYEDKFAASAAPADGLATAQRLNAVVSTVVKRDGTPRPRPPP